MCFLEKLSFEVYNQFLVYITIFILHFLPEGERERKKETEIDDIDTEKEKLNILIGQIFITSQLELNVATKFSSLLSQPFVVRSSSFLDS